MSLDTIPTIGPDGPRALAAVPPGELRVTEHDHDGVRILVLRGELDLSTAPSACARLDAARRVPRPRVVVDLSGLQFCDSTGLRALLGAAHEIEAAAGRLVVVVPEEHGPVGRLLAISGVQELLRVHDSLPSALAAL